MEAEPVDEVVVGVLCEVVGRAEHMEQKHRHEREGQREHTAAEEEIVQTEPVREVIPRIGQLTAANNLKLLCFRDASVGSGHLQFFHRKAPFCVRVGWSGKGSGRRQRGRGGCGGVGRGGAGGRTIVVVVVLHIGVNAQCGVDELDGINVDRIACKTGEEHRGSLANGGLAAPVMLDGTADGQAVVAHVDEAGDGTGEGSLTHQSDEVGDEVVCKLLRRDDIGTALDVDHFILGDGSIGCRKMQRSRTGIFHGGKTPFVHQNRRKADHKLSGL